MIITIVGLGVIGASLAMALKSKGYENVYGIDINKETIDKAKHIKIIKNRDENEDEILKKSDIVIISIYPSTIASFIDKHKNNFKENAIVTDVAGVKGKVKEEISNVLPKHMDFILGHPMAGREKKGIDYANKDVFKDANYLLIDTMNNNDINVSILEELIYACGFKTITKISSKFHDEIISFTSQLPHALAVALINSDCEDRETSLYIGDSYRELTRIANINEVLWSELFISNKENLLESIENFSLELNKLRLAIKNDDNEELIKQFTKSSLRRQRL